MLRLAGGNDPLLGRPLAVYDVVPDGAGEPEGLDIVYLAVGRMTRRLAGWRPGRPLEVWGPLGNGFPPRRAQHLVMVAGGIGQTPFLALARSIWACDRYGDPPRQVPPRRQSHALLRLPQQRIPGRGGRFPAIWGRRAAEHRRWLGRPPRAW